MKTVIDPLEVLFAYVVCRRLYVRSHIQARAFRIHLERAVRIEKPAGSLAVIPLAVGSMIRHVRLRLDDEIYAQVPLCISFVFHTHAIENHPPFFRHRNAQFRAQSFVRAHDRLYPQPHFATVFFKRQISVVAVGRVEFPRRVVADIYQPLPAVDLATPSLYHAETLPEPELIAHNNRFFVPKIIDQRPLGMHVFYDISLRRFVFPSSRLPLLSRKFPFHFLSSSFSSTPRKNPGCRSLLKRN